MKKIYLCVTKDKYELPVAVDDTIAELSQMLGVPTMQIYSSLSKKRKGKFKSKVYREVEIDE